MKIALVVRGGGIARAAVLERTNPSLSFSAATTGNTRQPVQLG
jgi:hypothetical protein